jgi:hypothetical protein
MKLMFSKKNLKIGTSSVANVTLSDDNIRKIYLGTELIYGEDNTFYFIKDGKIHDDLKPYPSNIIENNGFVSVTSSNNYWTTMGGPPLYAYSQSDLAIVDDISFTVFITAMGPGIASGQQYAGYLFYSDIPCNVQSPSIPGAVIATMDLPYVTNQYITTQASIHIPDSIHAGIYFGLKTGLSELRIKDLYVVKNYR